MRNTTLAIATAVIWLASTPAGQAGDFDETVAVRAEILKSTNSARLGTCQNLMRDLYEWGILDQVATGIAFGVTDNMTEAVKQAEATGNHQLRRGSAGFLIGFCTATIHIHMANRNGAEKPAEPAPADQSSGPVFQSRTARLQNQDTFNPDYCRGHMGKLRDANVIDEVADVMLHFELDNAIKQGTSGLPRQDTSQGFVYGLCSAVLNAMMGTVQ